MIYMMVSVTILCQFELLMALSAAEVIVLRAVVIVVVIVVVVNVYVVRSLLGARVALINAGELQGRCRSALL